MSEFHDPELRHELGRLSGPYPDDNAAFAAWQRRIGQVRRRRAMAWTSGAAMSLIVGVVAVAAWQGHDQHTVVPEKATETTIEATTAVASTIPMVHIGEPTEPSTTASTTTLAPDTTPSSEVAVETTMPQPESGDAGGAAPTVTTHKAKGGSSGTISTVAPTTENTTPETHDSHGFNKTFTSIGGTVTVRQYKDHLAIVDITPADGFHDHQIDPFGHRISVAFTSATHRSEISVWLDNGTMKSAVIEKTDTHEESVPGDPYGGGDPGD
jgi:hypothetical protein